MVSVFIIPLECVEQPRIAADKNMDSRPARRRLQYKYKTQWQLLWQVDWWWCLQQWTLCSSYFTLEQVGRGHVFVAWCCSSWSFSWPDTKFRNWGKIWIRLNTKTVPTFRVFEIPIIRFHFQFLIFFLDFFFVKLGFWARIIATVVCFRR